MESAFEVLSRVAVEFVVNYFWLIVVVEPSLKLIVNCCGQIVIF